MQYVERKRGLGWYSRIVYPLLVILLVYVGISYEFKRLAIWDLVPGKVLAGETLEQFYSLRTEFLFLFFGLLALLVIWRLLVVRDKKKHPERYRRY